MIKVTIILHSTVKAVEMEKKKKKNLLSQIIAGWPFPGNIQIYIPTADFRPL